MSRNVQLFFAYDLNDFNVELLQDLAPHIDGVKIGTKAFLKEVPAHNRRSVGSLVREHTNVVLNKPFMVDIKIHDVTNTLEDTLRIVGELGADYVTVHTPLSDRALESAVSLAAEYDFILLAVTVLTELSSEECLDRYNEDSVHSVLRFARLAHAHGVRGFVCAAHEARIIRSALPGEDLIFACPAIRPSYYQVPDEQTRAAHVADAGTFGIDIAIVGRPIYAPPLGMTYAQAAKRTRDELDGKLPPGSIVDIKA